MGLLHRPTRVAVAFAIALVATALVLSGFALPAGAQDEDDIVVATVIDNFPAETADPSSGGPSSPNTTTQENSNETRPEALALAGDDPNPNRWFAVLTAVAGASLFSAALLRSQ